MVENSKSYLLELFNASDWPEGAFFIDKTFSGKEIILYGAGESSHWFVEIIMKMHGYTPTVVIDKSFNKGDKYEGILAYNPSEFNPTEDQKENAIVVISVTNTKFHAEIKSFLEILGFMNIIFLKDIYEIHNPFGMPKELNTRGFEYYKDNKDKVIMSFELFEDDESREVFIKYIQTHMTRIPVSIAMRPRNEQYFPKDIKLNKGHSSFVSCGSYDGDTVRLLNSIYGKVKDVVCFEAEPSIFGRLNNFIEINKNNIADNIVAMP